MYYCDDSWHDGQRTDADYLIRAPGGDAFATCEDDVARALKIMLDKSSQVTVRRVKN